MSNFLDIEIKYNDNNKLIYNKEYINGWEKIRNFDKYNKLIMDLSKNLVKGLIN